MMPALKDKSTKLVIRLAKFGCRNRPFFHIVVARNRRPRDSKPSDELGSYDPLPNSNNERMVALNMQKLLKYISSGVLISTPVAKLLGIGGYLPIYPTSYLEAKRIAERNAKKFEESKDEAEDSS